MRINGWASLREQAHGFTRAWLGNPMLFPIMCGVIALAFLLVPGSVDDKTQAALHGLCAQRPSHSFVLGGERLPFDARMSGIYGGFAAAFAVLVWRGRLWALARPSWSVLGVLGLFVATLAVDGTNSLLLDLDLWHPYAPRNDLRLITGLLTGVALAATVCFLLSATLWRRGRGDLPIVRDGREVGLLACVQLPFAAAVLWGPDWLFAPVALGLVVAATVLVASLALVIWTIAWRRDGAYSAMRELGPSATVALLLAIVVMGSIAGGRFWLERMVDAPPLT